MPQIVGLAANHGRGRLRFLTEPANGRRRIDDPPASGRGPAFQSRLIDRRAVRFVAAGRNLDRDGGLRRVCPSLRAVTSRR